MMFTDRAEAGEMLADKLQRNHVVNQTSADKLLVLSIPRGGVIAGQIIANRLGCRHDVIISKKIGFPKQPEAAIGAIAEDGPALVGDQIPNWFLKQVDYLETQKAVARHKVQEYIKKFRSGRGLDVGNKTIILVDDGIATGDTITAAVRWLKAKAKPPATIIIATPVCSPRAVKELAQLADDIIYLDAPLHFYAVGQFYRSFAQVSDDEVVQILKQPLNQKAS